MKHFLIPVMFAFAYSLTAQDLAELDRRNGFKNLKLVTPIDSVKGDSSAQLGA